MQPVLHLSPLALQVAFSTLYFSVTDQENYDEFVYLQDELCLVINVATPVHYHVISQRLMLSDVPLLYLSPRGHDGKTVRGYSGRNVYD
jgi:hypothetical protein